MLPFLNPLSFVAEIDVPGLLAVIVLPSLIGLVIYFGCQWRQLPQYRWGSLIALLVGAVIGFGFFKNAHSDLYSDYNNLGRKMEWLHDAAFILPIVVGVGLGLFDFFRRRALSAIKPSENIF